MAIQFPSSPNVNDTHVVGDITYTWNGTSWNSSFTGASYDDSAVATYLNGNLNSAIIPDTNDTYDIGSAEYKIRDFYLSNNSMKFVDDTDPQNLVEYSLGVDSDYNLQYNGASLNTTSYQIHDGGTTTIDFTKRNHFVTNGIPPLNLPNGISIGTEIQLWRSGTPGVPGVVDILVVNAIWTDANNDTQLVPNFLWRLGNGEQGHCSAIWSGNGWVLDGGSLGV